MTPNQHTLTILINLVQALLKSNVFYLNSNARSALNAAVQHLNLLKRANDQNQDNPD